MGVVGRIAGLFGALMVVWTLIGFMVLRSAVADANSRISQGAKNALDDPGGGLLGTPQTILVLGSDADRDRTGARADTVMLMRTVPADKKINYLSIPRDLRVDLPPLGHMKITETYAHRGIRGVLTGLRREFGIPVNHVMVIDFKGVSKMVDAVGGITIDNPFDLVDCAYPGGTTVTFRKGRVTLDGTQALQYSRVRSCDDDFARARRQQLVIGALQKKTLSFTSLPRAPFRGAKIVRTMSTDMGTMDIAKFGWIQSRYSTGMREVLATDPLWISGVSYQTPIPDRAEEQIARFMGR